MKNLFAVALLLLAQLSAFAQPMPPGLGGGEGGTNGGLGVSNYVMPDYGTNLWIAQVGFASGNLTAIASNTLAGVAYELQTRSSLNSTDQWLSTGIFITGSQTTNWTALNPVAVSLTNNMFIRLLSWAEDGSGLPLWWQLQYFGTTGIDPNALDAAGDGWTIYQKFQMGLNPDVFSTPPAPQNVTVTYNAGTETANISWLPSPGAVIGYTVQRVNDGTTTNFTVVGTNFEDNLSDWVASDDYYPNQALWQNFVSYNIQANYADGASASSVPVRLAPAVSAVLVPGPQGSGVLAVSSMPANTVALQLFGRDALLDYSGDTSHDTNIYFSVNTNGLYPVANELAQPDSGYGRPIYAWYVQAISADGSTSGVVEVSDNFRYDGDLFNASYEAWTYSWMLPPYYDGRTQLKDNIRFLLRAATVNAPFHYAILNDDGISAITNSPDYVYSGFYDGAFVDNSLGFPIVYFDPLEPIEDNYQYANFVFNPAELDDNGRITNGLSGDYSGVYQGLYWPNAVYQLPYPTNNDVTFSSLLATNATRWLCTYPFDSPEGYAEGWTFVSSGYLEEIGVTPSVQTDEQTYYDTYETMAADARNLYGLPFLSAQIAWGNTSDTMTTLAAGSDVENVDGYFYPETAQPQLQTVEYDFWGGTYYGYFANYYAIQSPLPGMTNFSPTNASSLLIAPVGAPGFQVVGYAKLSVQNGYSGVYGYLGQYFDQAYQIDTNGVVTTNTTGVLSSYGNFFPTQPGPVALVTMPDLDTGAQGTAIVYAVSLQLDANHDGTMDTSFNGADVTSANSPYIFWANNNYDRWHYDPDDNTNYMDDVLVDVNPGTSAAEPDCDYTNAAGDRAIPCTRDLEDFTRLWVCGITSNLLAALPSGSTITLNWGDVGNPNSANPTIDLFQATDADGGMGYLTNETAAANQIDPAQSAYVGRVAPGGSLPLNTIQFANNWAGNHFIWCGVSNGIGQLNLTIADANGNVLAQASQWIQIVDIKQMYERWTVGDSISNAPADTASLAADNGLPAGVPAFQYPPPPDTNTPYILFVHGWNMESWEKDRFAETAFKRLYWQGYQGRFGEFRWPTTYHVSTGITAVDDAALALIYDPGEYQAWQSSVGLENFLSSLHSEYGNNVYILGHSMGNVVVGEALRRAAQDGLGQLVNTYVASQAAVPGHCYDSTLSGDDLLDFSGGFGPDTPNIYNNWLTETNAVGAMVNFYNTNDYALGSGVWQLDQISKPDIRDQVYYYASSDLTTVQDLFKKSTYDNVVDAELIIKTHTGIFPTALHLGDTSDVQDRYEIMAFDSEPRSLALGAIPDVHNVADVDLTSPDNQIWPSDLTGKNYGQHFWHSAEFEGDYPQQQGYWNYLLSSKAFKLK